MNPGGIIGAANRERVRNFLATHIGATNRECAEALGLGIMAVGRHVKTLRSEWQKGHLDAYIRTGDAVSNAAISLALLSPKDPQP
jgi:predicted ArsR family transcriptional regulator